MENNNDLRHLGDALRFYTLYSELEKNAMDAILKRTLDIVVSIILLLLLLPIFVVIAIFIRLSSPGPVFFRQQRVGIEERLFWLYKFRSMRPAQGGPAVTSGGDSRITPIGKLLRKWKLDELPQFLNVLKGDMSLVGPRPEVPQYVQYYDAEQRKVLTVRPGITGATQLEFRHEETLLAGRSDVESFYISTIMPQKLQIDLGYVQSRTFWGDLALLFRTLIAIAK